VREFIPWHVVKKKIAERNAVDVTDDLEEDDDNGPDSGVQDSVSVALPPPEAPPLSYKVYTVKELDAAPPSSRMSMVAAAEREPSPWVKTWNATLAVIVTAIRWVRSGKFGRPPFRDAMHVPVTVLRVELAAAVREMSWQTVATAAGIAIGTFGVILFTVLTVAELTDDYHAPGAAKAAQAMPTSAAPPLADNAKAAVPVVVQPVATSDPPPAMELDDDPPPPPKTIKKAAPVKKAAPAPKSAEVEVFIP
jgi:hypothetical protein